MIETAELQTTNCRLRNFVQTDIEKVFEGLSNFQVTQFYGVHYENLEATREQMEWFQNLMSSGTGIWFAIYSLDNSKFLGAAGFNNLNRSFQKAEIGFWLLPEFWRKKIISEVLPELCNYAYSTLDLNRIEAFVEAENFASKNALKKAQFHHEGTMKESEIKNRKFINIEIYARLKKDCH